MSLYSEESLLTRLCTYFCFMNVKDMVNNTEEEEHILLQQPTQSIHKPCITLHKEPDCEILTMGEKVRKENKRIIVRSSYFKHKSESNDEQESNQKLSDQNNATVDMHETTTSEVAFFTSNSYDSSITKRKASPNENIQIVSAFMQSFY